MADKRKLPSFINRYDETRRAHVDAWIREMPQHAVVWRRYLAHWGDIQMTLIEQARSLDLERGWRRHTLELGMKPDVCYVYKTKARRFARLLQHPAALAAWLAKAFSRDTARNVTPQDMQATACRIVNLCAPVTAVEAFAVASRLPCEIVELIVGEYVPPAYRR
jgi:hypothetical protein